jgi:hypothetical protein
VPIAQAAAFSILDQSLTTSPCYQGLRSFASDHSEQYRPFNGQSANQPPLWRWHTSAPAVVAGLIPPRPGWPGITILAATLAIVRWHGLGCSQHDGLRLWAIVAGCPRPWLLADAPAIRDFL